MFAKHQAMNRSFDALALVNTYGAFGSVGDTRYELVIEGTRDADPDDRDVARVRAAVQAGRRRRAGRACSGRITAGSTG